MDPECIKTLEIRMMKVLDRWIERGEFLDHNASFYRTVVRLMEKFGAIGSF